MLRPARQETARHAAPLGAERECPRPQKHKRAYCTLNTDAKGAFALLPEQHCVSCLGVTVTSPCGISVADVNCEIVHILRRRL